jgi:predicted phage terminase large subunit-like protein
MNTAVELLKAGHLSLPAVRKQLAQRSLHHFLKQAWPHMDGAPFMNNWHLEDVCEHLEAVNDGQIKRIIFNVPPRTAKTNIVSIAWPAWTWCQEEEDGNPLLGPAAQFLYASYAQDLSWQHGLKTARLVKSDWYQENWGDRVQITKDQDSKGLFETTAGGGRLATSVGAKVTGFGGNILVIDDPHNVAEAESDVIRQKVLTWYDESLQSRMNDQRTGALVVIMQRVNELDLTGHILATELDFVHVKIPMRYDSSYPRVKTPLGWRDPRTQDGELLWPERFPADVCDRLEKKMGGYGWCTPGDAPVLMGDLSLRPIGGVSIGDEVIGWSEGDQTSVPIVRRKLTRARVVAVHRSRQPVVKVTLSSGRSLRCTQHHRWFTGRNDGSHRPYLPARVGSDLLRVCDPELPVLSAEDARLAGWLAGFFDGEGTVTRAHVKAGSSGCVASFAQGAGRNLPLCEKVERVLTHFGFDYGFKEGVRQDRRDKIGAPPARWYWIRWGSGRRESSLQAIQKFLHVIGPSKWRDRLIEGALVSRFIVGRERVVSIDQDGEEDVFSLTTETGNYVVYGLASSNSGQYQQAPTPRGGGIFKDYWWQLWDDGTGRPVAQQSFPPFEMMIASVDTSYGEKEEGDYSAMTIWGSFVNERGQRRFMLVYAWKERLQLNPLVNKIRLYADKYKIDRLLIEAKASGISVAQEIRRLVKNPNWGVQLIPANAHGGDKVARAHSVSHIWENGLVYAPNTSWASMVIDEMAAFPKTPHDDITDSATQAMRWMRLNNFVVLDEEKAVSDREDLMPRKVPKPLYSGV